MRRAPALTLRLMFCRAGTDTQSREVLMAKQRLWPTHCDRCGSDLSYTSSTQSMFNTEVICGTCQRREQAHPMFGAAKAASDEALAVGDLEFVGIGLPAELASPFLRPPSSQLPVWNGRAKTGVDRRKSH